MDVKAAPFRPVAFGPVAVLRERRADGSEVQRAREPLGAYPRCLTERLLHFARATPERVFLARRGADGRWIEWTYGQTAARMKSVAQALLDRGLTPSRGVAILSGNGLEHALLALAAMHVGVPCAPISPAYALLSEDFGKLRHCLSLLTPGLLFVEHGAPYARALAATVPPECELVVAGAPLDDRPSTPFAELVATSPTPAVDRAFAAVTPDTVAKILFTSGSTGLPKGVINTQRMLCANQQQILQSFAWLCDTPPVIVDWLPWNHTFGGNHNFGMALYNGGTLYIDDGRPVGRGIETTVANLRDIAPTIYFNVPKGFEDLLPFLEREPTLARHFFSRLDLLFYAGAGLPQPVWDRLEAVSVATTGRRITITSGLGSTESAPSALFAQWSGGRSGHLGVPVAGLELKLVPTGDKTEARYRGPNITPGYWRAPEATAAAFDDEGFYCTGDALRPVDPDDPDRGLRFDGRIAEDFKLATGTWVSVGPLRAALVNAGAPLVQDVVIAGHDRDDLAAILFLNRDACRVLTGFTAQVDDATLFAHPAVRDRLAQALGGLAASATGSASRVERALVADLAPSIDAGEITDKGSLNQGAILRQRAALVDELYARPRSPRLIVPAAR